MFLSFIVGIALGCALGACIVGVWGYGHKKKAEGLGLKKEYMEKENAALKLALEKAHIREETERTMVQKTQEALEKVASITWGRAFSQQQQQFFTLAQQTLSTFHKSLSQDQQHQQTRLTGLLEPLSKALDVMDSRMRHMEQTRAGAYEGLLQQVNALMDIQHKLRQETTKLSHALKNPQARGQWGEFQLRRVVELAGMIAYCDFMEQETISSPLTKTVRPDMIVRMPERHHLAIDAKVPLSSYLEALEVADESARSLKFKDHAKQLRGHIKSLSLKEYWTHVNSKIHCVVLFLPHESFLTAALEHDGTLMEFAAAAGVILATPMTLIGLLKVIAFGWSQVTVIEKAQELHQCGKELSEALHEAIGALGQVGKHLGNAVRSYNTVAQTTTGSLGECATRLRDLGFHVKEASLAANLIKIQPLVLGEETPSHGESLKER